MPAHLLLAHFAQDGLAAWENFKMWSRSPHADSYDIAWASAAAVIDAFPGQSLSRLLALLSAVETTDVSTATVILATPYVAKGLSWPWVALLDTYMLVHRGVRCSMDADPRELILHVCSSDVRAATELCNVLYVAMTRAELQLYIPQSVHGWLSACYQRSLPPVPVD